LTQCQRSKSVGGNPTIRATIPMMASVDIAGGVVGAWRMLIGLIGPRIEIVWWRCLDGRGSDRRGV
jgi:hypothetical protein